MLGEPELPPAPGIFTVWAAEHPLVAGLDIDIKREVTNNELSRYRYHVTIRKTPHRCARRPAHSAGRDPLRGPARAAHPVDIPAPQRRCVTDIPRVGLISDIRIEGALAAGLPLAVALAHASATATPDPATPEQLHGLDETTGYHVAVTRPRWLQLACWQGATRPHNPGPGAPYTQFAPSR